MKYYQVKQSYDNKNKYVVKGKNNIVCEGILIGNELYTPKEREKIKCTDETFDIIEISKIKTYWLFGARFYTR